MAFEKDAATLSGPGGMAFQLLAVQQPAISSSSGAPALQQHGGGAHAAGHTRVCLEPKEIYSHIAAGGDAKRQGPLLRELVLGLLAGCFIGFGYATCMIAAGQLSAEFRKSEPGMFNLLFGAYGFPVGLSLCVINGASLFTSNIAYMSSAFMEGRSSGLQALRVVGMSYFSNLAGSLLLVQLMVWGDVFAHREAFTIELALKKTSHSFGATLVKGILCNWLVCMAVWQANAAQDVAGKLLAVWFPISAFVTMGFEHCVANMFLVPLAIKLGAPLTVGHFIARNLVPATIGNLLGGAVFVAGAYGMAFGSWGDAASALAGRAGGWLLGRRPLGSGGSSSSRAGSRAVADEAGSAGSSGHHSCGGGAKGQQPALPVLASGV